MQQVGWRAASEYRHGRKSPRGDAAAAQNRSDGAGDNSSIQPQAPMVHVPNIEPELLLPRERVSAAHLRPSGNARKHLVPSRLLWGVTLQVFHEQWTRSHHAELSSQDVPQLGKL